MSNFNHRDQVTGLSVSWRYCQGSLRSYRYTRQQYAYRGNSAASHHNGPCYTGHLYLRYTGKGSCITPVSNCESFGCRPRLVEEEAVGSEFIWYPLLVPFLRFRSHRIRVATTTPRTPIRTPTIMAACMLLLDGRRHGSVDGCGCVAGIIVAIPRGERKIVQEEVVLESSSFNDTTPFRLLNSIRRVIGPFCAQLRY